MRPSGAKSMSVTRFSWAGQDTRRARRSATRHTRALFRPSSPSQRESPTGAESDARSRRADVLRIARSPRASPCRGRPAPPVTTEPSLPTPRRACRAGRALPAACTMTALGCSTTVSSTPPLRALNDHSLDLRRPRRSRAGRRFGPQRCVPDRWPAAAPREPTTSPDATSRTGARCSNFREALHVAVSHAAGASAS